MTQDCRSSLFITSFVIFFLILNPSLAACSLGEDNSHVFQVEEGFAGAGCEAMPMHDGG